MTDFTPFLFLKKLLDTNIFDQSEAINLFEALIDGKLDETQTAVFLTGLAFRPDNPLFLANAASEVLKRGQKLPSFPHNEALDTCGTGGDYSINQ